MCRRLTTIEMFCEHSRLYEKSKLNKKNNMFQDGKLQLTNTIIQTPHSSKSIRGNSRSKSNKLANTTDKHTSTHTSSITSVSTSTQKPGILNRTSTKRAVDCESSCDLKFILFCSSVDNKWYIVFSKSNDIQHTNHLPISKDHITANKVDLDETIRSKVIILIQNGVSIQQVIATIKSQYQKTITCTMSNIMPILDLSPIKNNVLITE